MDIVGPLPEGPGRVKYLIMATEYFTKWMEAKLLATITGKQVVNFTWDNIFCRFRIPATIITDNGNGVVERANRSLLRGIKTRLEEGGSAWAEEMPNVLWAHRTIKKTSATCKTPEYLYFYYVSLLEKQFSKYRLAPEQKGMEQTLLPFAHNKYSMVSSYIGWRKQHENINLNVASKCIRAQAVPVGKGLPNALAHGLQPESCCGKTRPCWLNRPDPYKSRHLSDK
ncbi:reverse transcriptase domain-containing protein [Tanacetum coccineum]